MAAANTTEGQAAEPTMQAVALRHAQAAAYQQEDFAACFAAGERLAIADPAYGKSYAHFMHTALHTLARTVTDVRFLQVGGMDGKRFDPVYAFVKHYRWSGVIMEPLPDLFAALATNYADAPQVRLLNAALMQTDGTREMTRVSRAASRSGAVPDWAEGLGSFHPERNALGGVGVDAGLHAALMRHSVREVVSCLTLASVAEQCGLKRIDLLQVDAEGCELDVLRQVFGKSYAPRVVQLEHWALPAGERDAVEAMLRDAGYRLHVGEADLLAIDGVWSAHVDADAYRHLAR